MKEYFKTGFSVLCAFIVFWILTFPYSRLAPKMENQVEFILQKTFDISAECNLRGFYVRPPATLHWNNLECFNRQNQSVLNIRDGFLALGFSKKLGGSVGTGQFSVEMKRNQRMKGAFQQVPMNILSPLLLGILSHLQPGLPRELKFEGSLQGQLDFPLENYSRKDGEMNLTFVNLKLPPQPVLDLIGLRELQFDKAKAHAELKNGKLKISEVHFSSPQLAGKVEGEMNLRDDILKSSGNMVLKWKVERSDALLSSPLGATLLNAPCGNQDAQGFCTRRISTLKELF